MTPPAVNPAEPTRRPLRRRLFARIAFAFFVGLFVLGPFQYFALRWSLSKADDVVLQLQLWNVATEYVKSLEPRVDADQALASTQRSVFQLNEINPLVDAYLVELDGTVVYSFSRTVQRSPRVQKIRVEPILRFLRPEATRLAPIYGDDPDSPGGLAVFSAAPMQLAGKPLYFYAVVGGFRRAYEYKLYSENYLARYFTGSSLVAILAVVVMGVVLFFVLTRRVVRTVNSIRAFRDGDLSSRIGVYSNDELGELAATFDQMADKIAHSVEALEQRDGMRRELIATISHDLRGPLANIMAHLERVQQHEQLTSTATTSLETVQRNADQLGDLLSQLFELAKLEAKEVAPQLEEHLLLPLFDDLMISYQLKAQAGGVTLRYTVEPRGITVFADLTMLGRVLGNLIENALRFTSHGGEVVLTATVVDDRVRVSVRDTGIGIAEGDLSKIFEKFYQAESGKMRNVSSCGLGLSIVRRLVEIQGSQIEVASQKDVGTEFFFYLPQKESNMTASASRSA